jgi:hypothetical protein
MDLTGGLFIYFLKNLKNSIAIADASYGKKTAAFQ